MTSQSALTSEREKRVTAHTPPSRPMTTRASGIVGCVAGQPQRVFPTSSGDKLRLGGAHAMDGRLVAERKRGSVSNSRCSRSCATTRELEKMNISIAGRGVHRRKMPGLRNCGGFQPIGTPSRIWRSFVPVQCPRQIDIVIVLDDRILMVDLKDWPGRTSHSPRLDLGFEEDTVWLTLEDWLQLNRVLRSTRALIEYLRLVLRHREAPHGESIAVLHSCVDDH